jgi:GNAT superfamily N-acetyltransferase
LIREAGANDFERLMELYAQLHPEDPALAGGEDRAVFEHIRRSDNLYLFVLEDDDGRVQATCYLNLIPNLTRGAAPYGIIENVVTDITLRGQGQGLGQRIMGHTLQFAWDGGCYKVMLQTGSRRPATHNFYKACGFSATDKFAFVARPPYQADDRRNS